MKITKRLLEAAREEAKVADAQLVRRLRDAVIDRQYPDGPPTPDDLSKMREPVTWQGLRDVLLMATGDLERATQPYVGFDRPWWEELAGIMDDVELNPPTLPPASALLAVRVCARAVSFVGSQLGLHGSSNGYASLEPVTDHAVGIRLARALDDLRESAGLLDEHLKQHEFRGRLEEWEPGTGISRAEYARRTYADDPTLSPTEYGRLIELADQEDLAAMLDAEKASVES